MCSVILSRPLSTLSSFPSILCALFLCSCPHLHEAFLLITTVPVRPLPRWRRPARRLLSSYLRHHSIAFTDSDTLQNGSYDAGECPPLLSMRCGSLRLPGMPYAPEEEMVILGSYFRTANSGYIDSDLRGCNIFEFSVLPHLPPSPIAV